MDHLNEPIGLIQQLPSYLLIKGFYIAKIRNKGNKELESIVIKLPQIIHYTIERETGEKKSGHAQSFPHESEIPLISIDSIAAAEELTLYAWSYSEPRTYLFDDISIRHSAGKGDVKIRGNGASLTDSLMFPLYLALALVLIASVWLFISSSHSKNQAQKEAITESKKS